MDRDFSKAERKSIRRLGGAAWERSLANAIQALRVHIDAMDSGDLSPFEVNQLIHEFHNGVSRELYIKFSESPPWFAVCGACIEGVLTEDDFADASEMLRHELKAIVARANVQVESSDAQE